ncbi:MAG: hypothetical protein QOE65_291 [Solirubrobacteraceae bacterium]|nr:hypothetical protein [Solirubrobacteraceae bacterium]
MVFFGTYDARAHPRVGVLMEGLRARRVEVVECNAPLDLDTAARVAMLRRPLTAHRLVWRIVRRWVTLARVRRGLRAADAVVVGYLGHFDVLLARCMFPRTPVLLDHFVGGAETAVDRGLDPGSCTVGWLRRLDHLALRAATLCVVDTPTRLELVPSRWRKGAVVVPIGAPSPWFEVATPPDPPPPLRVIFFGLFAPLQGGPTIGDAIARLRDRGDVRFTIVGEGQESEEARRRAGANRHVEWLGRVSPDALPELVARHHVCLGIFGTGRKALEVVPNKLYQGAAAGCAIVTSDTPEQRAALGEAGIYVPPGDAEALASALARLAEDPARVEEIRAAARARARAAFHPAAVVAELAEALQACCPR